MQYICTAECVFDQWVTAILVCGIYQAVTIHTKITVQVSVEVTQLVTADPNCTEGQLWVKKAAAVIGVLAGTRSNDKSI
jgi:hypothetical protein